MSLESIADSIKTLAVLSAVIVIAYSGFMAMTSTDPLSRNYWKEMITGVIIGLSIVFLAPVLASALTGGSYCA